MNTTIEETLAREYYADDDGDGDDTSFVPDPPVSAGTPGPTIEFREHQKPRTQSQWVVEQCLAYRAGDEPPIEGMQPLPIYRGGCNRRYFRCPRCRKLCETLFLPPTGTDGAGKYRYDVDGIMLLRSSLEDSNSSSLTANAEGKGTLTGATGFAGPVSGSAMGASSRTVTIFANFRCRRCHRLRYASQRYGKSNPLRHRPTPRKLHHQGPLLPYLHLTGLVKRAEKWLDKPEPTNTRDRLKYAAAMIDATLAMGR